MMNFKVNEALQEYGFSEKESKVYLTILEFGMATANEISDRAGINRSTIYDLLRTFKSKGISSEIIKNKTTYFEVASPEKLISILEDKKKKIQLVLRDLKEIQETPIRKPLVKVYQGLEGLKTVLTEILTLKKDTDVISTSKVFKVLAYNFPNYILNRKEAGIKARVIQEKSKETNKLKKSDKSELRKTKSIEGLNLDSMTFIYGENLSIIKLIKEELISVTISDKTITEDNRKVFELLWKIAK